ncbi:MAG: hypothetical protein IKA08_01370 [Alphaproteobacteria bacterium]|nr:hypothetical protein [Alphaproteobacteria bacterium]
MQKVSYMGNGLTTEFTFNFPYFENTNIVVTKNGTTATGYSIVGTSAGSNADIPYTGGKVVFEIAPTSLDNITIARSLPLVRVVDYQPTAKITPMLLNQDANYLMEVLKDMQDKMDTFYAKYEDIVNKDDIQNVLSKISYISQQLSNDNIMMKDDFYSHITNCLTQIPQNIHFELNDGTLTLKAGSKIYVPNGVGIFDTVTIANDITATRTDSQKCMVWYSRYENIIRVFPISLFYSGDTEPSQYSYMFWYDTFNNKCKITNNSGTTWGEGMSFPLALVSTDGTQISAIDQVFNGFGYIAQTLFVLPGVKGLIPNGRNTDGTLKSTSFCVDSVLTTLLTTATANSPLLLKSNAVQVLDCSYNEATNYNSNPAYAIVGAVTTSSSLITSLRPKVNFQLLDRNDKLTTMPDYTAGVSVSTGYVTEYPCFVHVRPIWNGNVSDLTSPFSQSLAKNTYDNSTKFENSVCFICDIGETISFTNATCYVYPLKGV